MTHAHPLGPLRASRPFSFDLTLSFLCSFAPTAGEQRTDDGTFSKAVALDDGGAALVELRRGHDPATLDGTVTSDRRLDAAALERVADRLRFQLSLDDDVGDFYARAERDAAFAPVVRRWFDHHHVKFPSPIEIATWAVLAQRAPIAVARRTKDALVAELGPTVTVDGVVHRAFPTAAAFADAPPAVLARIVGNSVKAPAIASIARALRDLDPHALLDAPYDEALGWLRALPRIGEWSAAFILFRGLGRMERLSPRPEPILAAARSVYGGLSDRALGAVAARYGRWCGYWALYLRRGGPRHERQGRAAAVE